MKNKVKKEETLSSLEELKDVHIPKAWKDNQGKEIAFSSMDNEYLGKVTVTIKQKINKSFLKRKENTLLIEQNEQVIDTKQNQLNEIIELHNSEIDEIFREVERVIQEMVDQTQSIVNAVNREIISLDNENDIMEEENDKLKASLKLFQELQRVAYSELEKRKLKIQDCFNKKDLVEIYVNQ